MTSDSIETDEKPCPLTVGEWIALLAAESRVKSGDKHLAVMMLLTFSAILMAAFSIILLALRETYFDNGGSFMGLISVAVLCVVSVILICCAYRAVKCFRAVMGIFWERDKNSEIIEEIIAGNLTDPDEIRKRWEDREAPANAEELLKVCEKQIETRWKIVKFLKLTGYSFVGNFKAIKEKIQFDILNESEAGKFIDACENRRERAKISLNEIAPLIGFDVVAMTVVATIVHEMAFHLLYVGLLIILFICFILLFILLAHYRTQVHAWTAFKEGAILRKPPAELQAS